MKKEILRASLALLAWLDILVLVKMETLRAILTLLALLDTLECCSESEDIKGYFSSIAQQSYYPVVDHRP